MKNLTITVDEQVASWARVWAAKQGKSLSKAVGTLLHDLMDQEDAYAAAMERNLRREPSALKRPGERYPTREELHDRAGLRRHERSGL